MKEGSSWESRGESVHHGRERPPRLASLLGDNLIKLPSVPRRGDGCPCVRPVFNRERVRTVKKIIVLALVALGAFAVYRKIQADRAELDLWTEATAASES